MSSKTFGHPDLSSRQTRTTIRSINWSWAAFAIVCLMTASCCGRSVRPPDDALTEPQELIDAMTIRLDELRSGRLRVIIEYYGDNLRGANLRGAVLVRQPEDIHVQLLSPFGDALQTLVSNGERLSLYDLEQQAYYYGDPTPQNIARILPFYMTAADIARVMLGGPPLDQIEPDTSQHTMEWDSEEGSYRLDVPLAYEDGSLVLWVRHGDWTVEGAKRFDADGDLVFELRTGDFEQIDGAAIPTRLRFLLEGDEDIDMSIEVESAEINIELPDALFELEPPAGVPQIEL